jgi:AcrR family transcriptional regulator
VDVAERGTNADCRQIELAAVRVITQQGVEAASVASLCDEAGIDEERFAECFASVDDVLLAVMESVVEEQADVVAATFARRRSLTESLKVALFAMWDDIERNPGPHLMARMTRFSKTADYQARMTAAYHVALERTQLQLRVQEQIHSITWELPVEDIARLMLAAIDGLITQYLVMGEAADPRRTLELLAYHLAQHGRRSAKNHPH